MWVVNEFTTVTKGFFRSSMDLMTPAALMSDAAGSILSPSPMMRLPRRRRSSTPAFNGFLSSLLSVIKISLGSGAGAHDTMSGPFPTNGGLYPEGGHMKKFVLAAALLGVASVAPAAEAVLKSS